ncbi:MAG: RagB/SusD family nutrient uptake outer membrane protein [Reichenbachiella sp.]|uniref:RagB/SusD family nutrient uptake outer membrane protein n=1 Tax=Reichenbachiella sp. TaxID=2184521 RepID=UPI00326722D7
MKINNIYKSILAFGVVTMLSVTSCTDNFEEINENPYGVSNEALTQDFNHLGGRIVQATQNIYSVTPAWLTQLQQNLIGDVFSGYMTPPTPFAGGVNNMNYALVNGWNGFPWSTAYQSVMFPLSVMDETAGEEFPQFSAWGKIIRVEAMHRVTDIYGPIIYSNFGQNPALYDSQEDVYKAFVSDLDEAITTLKNYTDFAGFTKFDLVYGGDVTKWIQFANSLKLRLAIRISEADATYAKTVGESALADAAGLIADNEGNFTLSESVGDHPLNTINNGWGDIRMSAEMESILSGYEDPRMAAYFEPATDASLGIEGQYKGIRMGVELTSKDVYVSHSPLTTFGGIQLMTSAEVAFLKAEAALRGWTGAGDAQANYETGVTLSMTQHGASTGAITAYLADNTKTPAPFVDAVNSDNDVLAGDPNLSTITIAWDAAADFETSLERIITQKWIAMYPDGQEAWSEFRRTGYPKVFPVVINNSGGKIDTDEQIKRINFVDAEFTTNPTGVQSGIDLLGGDDDGGTNLWWDVD